MVRLHIYVSTIRFTFCKASHLIQIHILRSVRDKGALLLMLVALLGHRLNLKVVLGLFNRHKVVHLNFERFSLLILLSFLRHFKLLLRIIITYFIIYNQIRVFIGAFVILVQQFALFVFGNVSSMLWIQMNGFLVRLMMVLRLVY